MNKYAIEIDVQGKMFRYSTIPYTGYRNDGDNSFPVDFLPHIIEISLGESAISLEGKAPIPSNSVKLWDGKGLLSNAFSGIDYESSKVEIYDISNGQELIFRGYLTEFSSVDGEVQFSVRVDDRFHLKEGVWVKFTANTFQYFEVRRPLNVEVSTSWMRNQEMDFEVASCDMWSLRPEVRRVPSYEEDIDLALDIRSYPTISSPVGVFVGRRNPDQREFDQFEGGWANLELRLYTHNLTHDRIFANASDDISDLIIPVVDGYVSSAGVKNKNNKYPVFKLDETTNSVITEWKDVFDLNQGDDYTFAMIGWPNSKAYEVFRYDGVSSLSQWGHENFNTETEWNWKGLLPWTTDPILETEIMSVRREIRTVDLLGCQTLALNDPYNRGLVYHRAYNTARDTGYPVICRQIKKVDGKYFPAKTELIVKSTAFAPDEVLENPALALGFMMFPDSVKNRVRFLSTDSQQGLRAKREKIFRYRIVDAKVLNGEQYLKLEIHDSAGMKRKYFEEEMTKWPQSSPFLTAIDLYEQWSVNTAHEFHYDHPQSLDMFPTSFDVGAETPLAPMYFNRHVSSIDFQIDIPNADAESVNAVHLKDRLKGERVEVIKDYESMLEELTSIAPDESDHSQVNLNILNNISGEFAIATSSEVKYSSAHETLIERVTFDTEGSVTDADVLESSRDLSKGKGEMDSDPKWTNLLTYNFSKFRLGLDQLRHEELFGPAAAKDYFMKKQFRTIRDAVPQKASDIGKSFPIIYGDVRRYPLIHAIGTNVTMESGGSMSAGKDVYIFASNRCNITDDSDITLYLDGEEGMIHESEFGFSTIYPHIVKSPFPNVVDDHSFREGGMIRKGQLPTPYHRVNRFSTLQGVTLYGIQLRGGEWDRSLGFSDRRFPIRNGVGDTKLLVDICGPPREGSLQTVTHPCDVFIQFVADNCEHPYSYTSIDLESFQRVKNKTRWYTSSVPLPEEILPFELMDRIATQFGFFWGIEKGKVRASLVDMDEVDHSRLISDRGDIVGRVEEIDEGYKNTFSELLYQYDKDWVNNSYRHEILLNKDNNVYCASAAAARGGKGRLVIAADYVYSRGVANDVVTRIAKVLCRRRKMYRVTVRKSDKIYSPGDVVTISYRPLNLRYDPVLIMSVKPNEDTYEMTFLKFF
jgi:hypothetical protein